MRVRNCIVIGVSGDAAAAGALEAGLQVALDDDAEAVLAHVVPIAGERFMPGDDVPNRAPVNSRTAELIEAGTAADRAGVRHTEELLFGYPPRELALLADDVDASLIVVGSRKPTHLKPAYLGSTSRHLLRETTRRVLVVPEGAGAPVPADV